MIHENRVMGISWQFFYHEIPMKITCQTFMDFSTHENPMKKIFIGFSWVYIIMIALLDNFA